jgi:MYXO-CTERM domain-containing protein
MVGRWTLALVAASLFSPRATHAQAPADGWVAWQSNRQDGRVEIYIAHADGTEVRRLTYKGGQRPRFSPDGGWISFQGFGSDDRSAFVIRPDGGGLKKIFDGPPLFWKHDGAGLVCEKGTDYHLVDPDGGGDQLLFKKSDFPRVAGSTLLPGGLTHDGRYLVAGTDLYRPGFKGDNGTFKASFAAVVLDLSHRDRVYFLGAGCWPFTPPAGTLVYHICGDCPTKPDIYRMDLGDLATRASYAPEKAHPDADWGHEYNPDISNDNKWLAYMASTGCHSGYTCDYEIFLHRLGAGTDQRVRVTEEPHFDGYPSIHIGPLGPSQTSDAGAGSDGQTGSCDGGVCGASFAVESAGGCGCAVGAAGRDGPLLLWLAVLGIYWLLPRRVPSMIRQPKIRSSASAPRLRTGPSRATSQSQPPPSS